MSKAEAALAKVPGVQEISINLATRTATVALAGEIGAHFQNVHSSELIFLESRKLELNPSCVHDVSQDG